MWTFVSRVVVEGGLTASPSLYSLPSRERGSLPQALRRQGATCSHMEAGRSRYSGSSRWRLAEAQSIAYMSGFW